MKEWTTVNERILAFYFVRHLEKNKIYCILLLGCETKFDKLIKQQHSIYILFMPVSFWPYLFLRVLYYVTTIARISVCVKPTGRAITELDLERCERK